MGVLSVSVVPVVPVRAHPCPSVRSPPVPEPVPRNIFPREAASLSALDLIMQSRATLAVWLTLLSPCAVALELRMSAAALRLGRPGYRPAVGATMSEEALETNGTIRNGIMAQRLAGKSDVEILESDLVKDLLRANADLLDKDVLDEVRLADLPKDLPGFEAQPSKGEAPWGRWSQTEETIALELFLEEGVRARDLRCEVSARPSQRTKCTLARLVRVVRRARARARGETQALLTLPRVRQVGVGFLDVRVGDDPLLSGRLAQPVHSDVEWLVDDVSSMLCHTRHRGGGPACRSFAHGLTPRLRPPTRMRGRTCCASSSSSGAAAGRSTRRAALARHSSSR